MYVAESASLDEMSGRSRGGVERCGRSEWIAIKELLM
jgi:hypothetical protein